MNDNTGGALNCPQCGEGINFASKKCIACGYLFSEEIYKKIFFYFDLKNDFKNLISVENSVSERLSKLSLKIKNYEQLLGGDLKNDAGAAYAGATEELSDRGAGSGEDFQKEFRQGPDAAGYSVHERQEPNLQTPREPSAGLQDINQLQGGAGPQTSGPQTAGAKSAFAPKSGIGEVKKTIEAKRKENFDNYHASGGGAGTGIGGAETSFSAPQSSDNDFEIMVGQKWMLIIGIITIVFGVGYFLKYSFERELIGPAGQVALAYLLGFAFLATGNFFHQKSGFGVFGLYMTGGAIAVFYFAAYAAFQLYKPPVVGQEFSFFIMVLITVLACTLSLRYDVKWLAVLAIIGGFLTPVLVSSGRDSFYSLMFYMTLLNCGVFFVSFKKNWNLLITLGFMGTYILYSGWHSKYYQDEKFWPAILFLNFFYLIYSVAPFAYQFIKKQTESSPVSGFFVMTLNSFIAFSYSYNMILSYFQASYYVSIVTVFYAAVFLAMASHLFKQGNRFSDAFVITLAMASLFLIITIPMIFTKHWITFFWAAQAFCLLIMAVKLNRGAVYTGSYLLFAIALFKLFFVDYTLQGAFNFNFDSLRIQAGFDYLLIERYIAWCGVLGLLFFAGGMLARQGVRNVVSDVKDSVIMYTIFGIGLFVVLNFETASFFYDYLPAARFAFISGLWACFAAALMIIGFVYNAYGVRKTSIALFLITLIKVFLFDMDNMSTPWRILSFMVLGVILIAVSFYYHKFKDKLIAALNDEGRKRL
jgi:hypothetical protein